ncbi:MAG TPA: surface carbohydrate biosynthesis protein, partial [Thermoanaerobaculia bacterium]|nr:surface carbohydrate biosynthesis protein [Thermoanaerobaculia bacterium]
MRIALVVDNPHRDLPGLVLLGSYLARRGATVYLAPMNLQAEELSALAPDLAVLNCLRRTNQATAAALLAAGVRLALLDTEGGVMESTDLYGRVMADDPELRAGVSRVCFWGERLAGAARREGWYPEEAIRVTGAPRFDLYAPPWRRAALARLGADRGVDGPRILVNSSFTLANPRFKRPEEESEMLVRRLGLDPEAVRRRLAAERAGLEGFLALADRLPRRFPEVTFVYRPHPFERVETYRSLVGSHRNLQVVAEGTVDGWLLGSSALIQLSSTTAVEAALAGVPSLSTDWLPTWHRLEPVEAVSISCSSEAALEDFLAGLLEGGEPPQPGP